jgi:multidrug efflux pump subunit AcrA (membrane-fusion protein)
MACSSLLYGQGVLLVKPQAWSDPSTAVVVPYASIEKFPAVYNIVTPSGQAKRINPPLVVDDISFAAYQVQPNIVSDADIQQFRSSAVKLRALAKASPKLLPYIKTLLESHQQAELALSAGKVRVNGVWTDATNHRKQQAELQKASEEAERAFAAQQEERKKSERAELELQITALSKEISDLEKDIDSNRQQIADAKAETSSPGYEIRRFLLQRKLPKAGFTELYDISDYVYECLTEGDEKCALISRSITTMEKRFLSIWVKYYSDIDVTMRNGNEERIPVFIEAEREISEELSAGYNKLSILLETIATLSTRLEEKRKKLNAIQETLEKKH